MFANRKILIPTLLLAGILLAGCNLFSTATPTSPGSNPATVYTEAAQTVIAGLTQTASAPNSEAIFTQAALTVEAELTRNAPSASLTPTPTLEPSATPFPTDTPLPTSTPLPTFTPTATPNPLPCDAAAFVADVTVPDGTTFPPNARFTKVWRLLNVGYCTWTTQYALVFVSGDRMGAPNVLNLSTSVRPGETVDLNVDMIAPNQPGTYRGNWMLRNNQGVQFGVGSSYDSPFWVRIRVAEQNSNYPYDFVFSVCDAVWSSGSTSRLPCPGQAGDSNGYVRIIDRPPLETGKIENEPALQTVPNNKSNGFIEGRYSDIKIKNGYHFRSGIMCEDNAKGCNVIFSLSYRGNSGQRVQLGSWQEIYDGQYNTVDVDLSFLDGDTVDLFLTVQANDSNKNNMALWWVPHIEKR
jgi:hypothetical protein